jgi:hypothetical protein
MREKLPKYGTPQYNLYCYERMKAANRGHNYEYWNEKKHGEMLKNGWDLYKMPSKMDISSYATSSEYHAIEVVEKLRTENNYARIIAGYEKNV